MKKPNGLRQPNSIFTRKTVNCQLLRRICPMNAKRLMTLFVFVLLAVCQACAPAATPAPIAVAPQQAPQTQHEQKVEQPRPAATMAIAAAPTAAPAAQEPVAPPTPDNQFQDYGVNPETNAAYDHLSTFALDVDTASYTVARRYINEGSLPPYDAVRVEEFVNAFDQGYAAPQNAAFTIYADGAPAPSGFDEGSYILRFGVQGYRVQDFERKPSVLTFVIDVSGSMGMENRLELVKRSLHLLVDRLSGHDSVAIVVYGTNARSVLPPTSGARRGVILNAIDKLRPEGSTNAEAGLRLGYRIAQQAYQEGANNRVILCSDGVANVGNIDAGTILGEVGKYVENGITLTTAGFGMGNFNDVLLEQLADRGNGNYAYIDTLDEARKLFVDNLTATLQVIAKDAKVQVDFNNDVVESYRLLGYENRAVADQNFRNDEVNAGELGAGHTATALYAVHLKPGMDGRVATVQLRWQDPDTGEVKEINGNFNTWSLAASCDASDPRYQLAVTVAQFAEVLRESPYVRVSLYELARRAERVSRLLPEDEQAGELADLIRQAASLRGE
jgi:Ca-activated chloride channel family protein